MPPLPRLTAVLAFGLCSAIARAQIAFDPAVSYAAATAPNGVALADFNGDRRADLAATAEGPDRIVVRLNTGAGLFGAAVSVPLGAGTAPQSLAPVDIDNDGDTDLVVSLKNANAVRIVLNSAGVLTAGTTTGVSGTDPRALTVGDLDDNGFGDVVTVNRLSGDVTVLLNSGGALGVASTYAVGGNPSGVALADLNGDSWPDIVASSNDNRALAVLFNVPSTPGVFIAGPTLSVGPLVRPDGVDIADLDADGDGDIVTATSGVGLNQATIFLNLGGGSFGPAINVPGGGVNPGTVLARDFNLDGRQDIALGNQDSNTITVLRNLGGVTFAAPVVLAVGLNPQALAAADIDRNGAPDLASANQDSDSVSVLRNASILFADGFDSGDLAHWSAVEP